MYICVYMHAYAYGCICASMILIDTSSVVAEIFYLYIRVHMHAYVCVCKYACIGACVYVCTCIYVCLCICMHIHIYARVWVYICTRVGAFCLFVLSNLSSTCACSTGVS